MILEDFISSIKQATPPETLSLHLQALWWDGKGDWDKAHHIADRVLSDQHGDWIHAYLHRKEGDSFNAGYWYNRAGQAKFQGSLDAEWEEMVKYFLDH